MEKVAARKKKSKVDPKKIKWWSLLRRIKSTGRNDSSS